MVKPSVLPWRGCLSVCVLSSLFEFIWCMVWGGVGSWCRHDYLRATLTSSLCSSGLGVACRVAGPVGGSRS